jgi:ATP-dependent protease ClpP protease subunit
MWYKAQKIENEVEVDIFDEIGGWGVYAKDFKDEVSSLLEDRSELIVNINSPGGSVFEGIEIYNYLKGLPNRVTVKINSLAASIATVIALGANSLHISESAFFMIHNPWTMAGGEAEDLRKQADVLDKIKETILTIYEKNSRLNRARIAEMMDEETWLTGQEALQYGFADFVTEGLRVAAMATTNIVNNFNNIPTSLKMAEIQETVETVEEVALEATEQVEETVEETTEEVVAETDETTEEVVEEVIEQKEEGILAKVKAFLSNKIENASNELQDRYAEVSNEAKELKEANADLNSELLETRNVLEESYEAMNALKASIEAKDLEIEELKNKLSETVTEELKPVVEVENKVTGKVSFSQALANAKSKK